MGSALVAMLLSGCVAPAAAPASTSPEPADQMDAEQIMQTALDDQWSLTGLPDDQRPDVARERVIALHEWPTQIASCLNDAGFTGATAGDDGGVESGPVPLDQQSAYGLANYICNARFPVAAIYNTPLDEAQLTMTYEYFRSTLTPCLTDLGFDVEEPPSLDTFIDEGGPSGWSPYMNLEGQNLTEAQETCPAVPDGIYGDASK